MIAFTVPSSRFTVAITLNGLADGATADSTAISVTADVPRVFMDIEIILNAPGAARSTGAYLDVFMRQSPDGSTYSGKNNQSRIARLVLDATATARRLLIKRVPYAKVPPAYYIFSVENQTGQTLSAPANPMFIHYSGLEV